MLRVLIVHLIIAALADAQRIWPKYGVIMSDNYPQPYTAALKRRWVIEVDIGQKIELSFGYPFEIEEPADDRHLCTHDKLQVYDANNVNILFTRPCAATNPKPDKVFCGTVSPGTYTSSNNRVVLQFCSDFSIQSTGFSLVWKQIAPPTPCGESAKRFPNDLLFNSDGYIVGSRQPQPLPPPAQRIIGGHVANEHSWPWIVALYIGRDQVCGGSLLNNRWVLSAAHCFPEYEVYKDYYRVKLGAHVKDQPETWQQVCKIETLFLHPDYGKIVNVTKANHNNDMALLKLDCTVNFTDAVLPTGDGDSMSSILLETLISPMNNEQCQMRYNDVVDTVNSYRITPQMFCAMAPGKDTCQRPGVYASVKMFLPWMNTVMNSN